VQGTERIKVKVPRGIRQGSKVRVSGKGEPGRDGGRPGDLYLVIRVKEHPLLERRGDDLFMELPVTVSEAMAGATVAIPTIDGMVNLKIPPKSQSGQVLKLRKKGALDPKKKERGDQLVKLLVKVPRTDDREILQAVERMDRLYEEDLRKNVKL
jgi:molecular chaperone DnaJ